MKVIYLDVTKEMNFDFGIKNLGLVLGLFDGVHIGHKELIEHAKKEVQKGSLGILTFDKALKSTSKVLMSINQKLDEFESLNVDYVFILVANEKLKEMSHIEFIEKILKVLNPYKLYCGPDFKFGYKAMGDVEFLKREFPNIFVLDFVMNEKHQKVSSTLIKSLIQEGKVEEANEYLGKAYTLSGTVIHGLNKGKFFGLPTANLGLEDDYVLPLRGVYFTKTFIDGKEFKSVTNVGFNPTVSNLKHPSIETFIIDCDDNLYGETMKLEFYKKIRDEKKFETKELLRDQVYNDAENCKIYFASNK